MAEEKRPEISEIIKRQVRQECYFGCVICGSPVFEYDHIIPYSEVKEHTAENLTLLCKTHHGDKTAKRINGAYVKKCRENPFNKVSEFSGRYKLPPDESIVTQAGSNSAGSSFSYGRSEYHFIWVDGVSYFTIHNEDGWLTVSLLLTDTKGNIVLKVEKGEIMTSTGVWDYKYEGSTIEIRAAKGEILLEMTMKNNEVLIKRGIFINSILDGYVVNPDGSLLTLIQGNLVGVSMGSRSYENSGGGWAIWNRTAYPESVLPGAFGFIRIIG